MGGANVVRCTYESPPLSQPHVAAALRTMATAVAIYLLALSRPHSSTISFIDTLFAQPRASKVAVWTYGEGSGPV